MRGIVTGLAVVAIAAAGAVEFRNRDCGNPEAKAIEVSSFHAAGGVTDGGDLVLKFANAAFRRQPVEVSLGAKVAGQKVVRTLLCAAPDAHNTPEDPHVVVPRKDEIPFEGGEMLSLVLEPCSVTVLRIAMPQ